MIFFAFSVSAVIFAYLIGSVSSAILICRFAGLPDPRTQGSKNAGATNVLRIGGKKLATMTLLGDVLKGVVAVMLGRIMGLNGLELGLVGLAVILGHLYPLYFGFKGGKGVATLIGVLFVLEPWLAFSFMMTWLFIALIFKYSSLAALVATALSPFYTLVFHDTEYFIPLLLMVCFVLWKHRENMKRLMKGKELKIKK